jgi:hypothetical protein
MKIWRYVEFNFFLWTNQMDAAKQTRTSLAFFCLIKLLERPSCSSRPGDILEFMYETERRLV